MENLIGITVGEYREKETEDPSKVTIAIHSNCDTTTVSFVKLSELDRGFDSWKVDGSAVVADSENKILPKWMGTVLTSIYEDEKSYLEWLEALDRGQYTTFRYFKYSEGL